MRHRRIAAAGEACYPAGMSVSRPNATGLKSARLKRIAYLFPANSIMNRVADGLFRYSLAWRDWHISAGVFEPAILRRFPHDALVGSFSNTSMCRVYRSLHLPMISVLGVNSSVRMPFVEVDNEAVGCVAADYLAGLGFRHFGFVGYLGEDRFLEGVGRRGRHNPVEEMRRQAFCRALGGRAASFAVSPRFDSAAENWRQPIEQWLRAQPKPVALLCVGDDVARWTLDVCRAINLAVREQVSVLGINDDEHVCRWTRPRLSSVAVPWEKMGAEIGGLLEQLFRDGRLRPARIRVAPTGIIERGSTARAEPNDPVIADVLATLRHRSHEPINLKQLLDGFPIQRRQIERRFKLRVGRTPLEELWRLRVEHARELLADTRVKYGDIALASGFSSSTHLARVFRALHGRSPGEYRRECWPGR